MSPNVQFAGLSARIFRAFIPSFFWPGLACQGRAGGPRLINTAGTFVAGGRQAGRQRPRRPGLVTLAQDFVRDLEQIG